MPDLDHQDASSARRDDATRDGAPSRRSVLRVAAGAGAAGVAAAALSGAIIPVAAAAKTTKASPRLSPEDAASTEAIVLHVRDAAAGEIDIFRGTSEVRVHDRDLAARIIRASK